LHSAVAPVGAADGGASVFGFAGSVAGLRLAFVVAVFAFWVRLLTFPSWSAFRFAAADVSLLLLVVMVLVFTAGVPLLVLPAFFGFVAFFGFLLEFSAAGKPLLGMVGKAGALDPVTTIAISSTKVSLSFI
jgi:hypothetical protein